MPDHVTKELRDALDDGIKAVQVGAAERVAVGDGNLRHQLLSKQATGKRDKGLRVDFGLRTKALRQKRAFYAPFLEYGRESGVSKRTKRPVSAMKARPFLEPAFEHAKPFIKKKVRAGLHRAIKNAMRLRR